MNALRFSACKLLGELWSFIEERYHHSENPSSERRSDLRNTHIYQPPLADIVLR